MGSNAIEKKGRKWKNIQNLAIIYVKRFEY